MMLLATHFSTSTESLGRSGCVRVAGGVYAGTGRGNRSRRVPDIDTVNTSAPHRVSVVASMPDVYVYVTDERYASCCSTTELSDTVRVDRLDGDIVGVEVLSAYRVTVDGVDVSALSGLLRAMARLVGKQRAERKNFAVAIKEAIKVENVHHRKEMLDIRARAERAEADLAQAREALRELVELNEDKGAQSSLLAEFADAWQAAMVRARAALAGSVPAAAYSVSINNGLLATLDRYLSVWEISQAGHGPWPDDPDGGELRIVMALRDILAKTRHGDVQALVRSQFEPPGPNAPRSSLPDLNDVLDDSETWPGPADHTSGGAGVQERVCALCGHVMTLDRCGSAGAHENGHVIYLCHTDDHDCYHRWTVYRERPADRTAGGES